jgi:hypothetical protein
MTPDTYTFSGDAITFLGLVGVTSTLLILVTAFRRFFNSPYNIRVKVPTQQIEDVSPSVSETYEQN